MKNLVFKDTLREIRKTKSRYFSIFAIVFIGVAFFSGILAIGPDMRYSVDDYYDDYHLMDVRVVSTLGITENDIAELKKFEEIKGIQPAYSVDVFARLAGVEQVVRVHSYNMSDAFSNSDNYLNRLVIKEGRMPNKPNECVIEYGKMMASGFQVGDTISLYSHDDLSETLTRTQYTIVGMVNTPYYLSFQKGSSDIGGGTLNTFIYVDESNFCMDVYTEVFMTFEGLDEFNSYNQEYFDQLDPITNQLKALGIVRSEIRTNEILDDAYAQLNDAKQQYQDGVNEFNEKIADAEKQIADGQDEILLGKSQIATAKILLESTIQTSESQINMLEEQIVTYEKQYETYKKQFEDRNQQALDQKETLKKQNETLKSQMDEKQSEYDGIVAQIEELNQKEVTLQNQYDQKNDELSAELSKPLDEQDSAKIAQLQSDLSQITIQQSENTTALIRLEMNSVKIQYESLQTQYDSNLTTIEMIDASLESTSAAMQTMEEQIDNAYVQLNDARKTLADTKAEQEKTIAENEAKIKKAEKDLINAQITLEEEKAKGLVELADAEEEIAKAERDIMAIEEGQWYVLDRNSHYSYVDYQGAAERMDAIAVVFPVFFFLVAALVCMTTMTRLVDEQRSQIGTMKALGYSTAQIAFKYVFYAASATIAGALLGLGVGMTVFPWIIYTVWTLMYIVPPVQFQFQPLLMVGSVLMSVFVTTVSTFGACYKELIETPSLLMRPKAPKLGKKIMLERIEFLWSRFSFTSKVTARNLFRYKKRMLMTVVGISGCTALLIAGFGVKDSINDIVDIQFYEVFKYEASATLSKNLSTLEKDEIVKQVNSSDLIEDVLLLHNSPADLIYDDQDTQVTLVAVADPGKIADFVSIHDRSTQTPYALSFDQVIVTERVANDFGIKAGDSIQLTISDGLTRSFEVQAIMENYVNHYVYMSSQCYKDAYGVKPYENTLYLKCAEGINENEIGNLTNSIEGMDSISFYTAFAESFSGMISSLNYIVIVLVACAAALAFVVLYNLTNVNISERIREIATLKVLGFHSGEVESYVFKENTILTMMGAIVGIVLGKGLHYLVMVMVELDNIMFGRNVAFTSYLISVVLTIVFGAVVNHFMRSRLREIPMVESLKSVE